MGCVEHPGRLLRVNVGCLVCRLLAIAQLDVFELEVPTRVCAVTGK